MSEANDSPTEAILDAARNLDEQSVADVLRLMHREDAEAHAAVGRVLAEIEAAVDVLVCSIRGGGRWFNVGAGSSGRMGNHTTPTSKDPHFSQRCAVTH